MSFRQYSADHQPAEGEEIYLADQATEDAVNVAILLGQPLLVTGEPGTGKTRLAHSIASQLQLGDPLAFHTKSTSTSQELFYHYDALGHFRASQAGGGTVDVRQFLRAEALGAAILRCLPTADPDGVALLGKRAAPAPQRSVVLIDEIDKAPRDFPNDILHEIERLEFTIPELGGREFAIAGGPDVRPIVLLTSNSEKHLPDAFLRRCVFCHLSFPDAARLARIVRDHHADLARTRSPFLEEALSFFSALRHAGARKFDKIPATAELIQWVRAAAAVVPEGQSLAKNKAAVGRTLGVLIKSSDDEKAARGILEGWAG